MIVWTAVDRKCYHIALWEDRETKRPLGCSYIVEDGNKNAAVKRVSIERDAFDRALDTASRIFADKPKSFITDGGFGGETFEITLHRDDDVQFASVWSPLSPHGMGKPHADSNWVSRLVDCLDSVFRLCGLHTDWTEEFAAKVNVSQD
jgi:hypothetical protein